MEITSAAQDITLPVYRYSKERFEGVSLKQDDDGWYVCTHRARSKSYPSPEKIPEGRITFIRSTGAVHESFDWDKLKHPRGEGGKFTSSYGEDFEKEKDGSFTSHQPGTDGQPGHTTHLIQDPDSKKWQRSMSDESCGKSFFGDKPQWYDSAHEAAENTDQSMYLKMKGHRGDLHDASGHCIYDDLDPDYQAQLDRAHQTGFSSDISPHSNSPYGTDKDWKQVEEQRQRAGEGAYYHEPPDGEGWHPDASFFSTGVTPDDFDDPQEKRHVKEWQKERDGYSGTQNSSDFDEPKKKKKKKHKNFADDDFWSDDDLDDEGNDYVGDLYLQREKKNKQRDPDAPAPAPGTKEYEQDYADNYNADHEDQINSIMKRKKKKQPSYASLYAPVIPSGLDWVRFADFDPGEQRDNSGKWTSDGSGGSSDPPSNKSNDDKSYAEHVDYIKKTIADKVKNGETTDVTETVDGQGHIYKPARQKQHDQIVDELLRKTKDVPREGRAIISGGLGGAGKTTVLTKHAGIDQSKWITCNPDDIKEIMAKKGMIPKIDGLSPMEAAPLVHEESGAIAQQLAHRAQMERRNMIWDITMSSTKSVDRRLRDLRASGYNDIGGVFVDIPVETSVERAMARHKHGMDDYKKGKGFGGRYVPPELIRKSKGFKKTKNKEVFDDLRPKFNEYGIWDNSGKAPKKVVGTGQWASNE